MSTATGAPAVTRATLLAALLPRRARSAEQRALDERHRQPARTRRPVVEVSQRAARFIEPTLAQPGDLQRTGEVGRRLRRPGAIAQHLGLRGLAGQRGL